MRNQATPEDTHFDRLGGAAGCHALAEAFYAHVERDPLLRPLFPSTFTCAIEEFSGFLVQFLGGESKAAQRRWWLSLRESHHRFRIGPAERTAWLNAMTATLDENIADAALRAELLAFFQHSSAHVVNTGASPQPAEPIEGELAPLWEEQQALDEVVPLLRSNHGERCVELLNSPVLQRRFGRSPSLHASVLAHAAHLREYFAGVLRAQPSLVNERYSGNRTLLHDACASGDLTLVELLLDLGAGQTADHRDIRSPLYCLANQCSIPGAGRIVPLLLQSTPTQVDSIYGVKRCTPLHMAARRGNVEMIEALLDAGAAIEARDSSSESPLRRAVNCNQVDAAKLLLARGADPHSVGSKGLTPARAARTALMRALF